jgi:hypothetical protein
MTSRCLAHQASTCNGGSLVCIHLSLYPAGAFMRQWTFPVSPFFPLSLSGWGGTEKSHKKNNSLLMTSTNNYSMLHFRTGSLASGCLVGWTHTLGRAFGRRSRPDNVFGIICKE